LVTKGRNVPVVTIIEVYSEVLQLVPRLKNLVSECQFYKLRNVDKLVFINVSFSYPDRTNKIEKAWLTNMLVNTSPREGLYLCSDGILPLTKGANIKEQTKVLLKFAGEIFPKMTALRFWKYLEKDYSSKIDKIEKLRSEREKEIGDSIISTLESTKRSFNNVFVDIEKFSRNTNKEMILMMNVQVNKLFKPTFNDRLLFYCAILSNPQHYKVNYFNEVSNTYCRKGKGFIVHCFTKIGFYKNFDTNLHREVSSDIFFSTIGSSFMVHLNSLLLKV